MSEDKFESLRLKLEEEHTFPMKYMFKFIVPNDKVSQIKPLFQSGEISQRASSKGTYVSVTIIELVLSPSDVIEKYKSTAHIKGLISL